MTQVRTVSTAAGLQQALADRAEQIEVSGTLSGMPSVVLPPGTVLIGREGAVLRFGGRGVVVTSDNTIRGLTIETTPSEIALCTDTSVASLGTLELQDITTRGQIALVFQDVLRSGRVVAERVQVAEADVRGREQRARGYNVEVLQGGFTVWNRQRDADSVVHATLRDISVGTDEVPVRGSGVFVAGGAFTDAGRLVVDELTTGIVVTDGGIAPRTPDVISGGVFVASGAEVESVVNHSEVITHGQNDMVLDNWGTVTSWEAHSAVLSYGPSGIGFVNFGEIGSLRVAGPLRTDGAGARGYNLYSGSTGRAEFASITTHGNGAVGIQLGCPSGPIRVLGDVVTTGSTGMSLVKGVQMELSAVAFSVKPGGSLDRLEVGGDIRTSGAGTNAVEIEGPVTTVRIGGRIIASGAESERLIPVGHPKFAPFLI
ncbi:hypothetical protein ACFYVL_08905 [Streptomyces sp. NPDC004111]|uniref:hypothetical protein n=1 Tax=Streptomyces sp. NPDC004111 TaxID=3364690 RepID=UPI0036C17A5B